MDLTELPVDSLLPSALPEMSAVTSPALGQLEYAQNELIALLDRLTIGLEGVLETAIPGVAIYRVMHPEPRKALHKPAFAAIAQGSKRLLVGDELYIYDPLHYLVSSVELPVVSQVVIPDDLPYLGMRMDLDVDEIDALIRDDNLPPAPTTGASRGLYVDRLDMTLLDVVLRLLRLLDTPRDIPILAPMIKREILYRLLMKGLGAQLRQIAMQDSHTHRIAKAIRMLRDNFSQPLRIESIASEVHMSVSSFHHHFKAVTAMSPLQYQKQLKLHEARRLLLMEDLDVSMAAHLVGYESPSQFSREYSRMFGASPVRDRSQWMESLAPQL